ncbi:hypothetical protein KI387_006168, partial [Taxus chinensis]
NKHLSPLLYAKLAEDIGLSRKQVRDWFREEREKENVLKRKRETKESNCNGSKMKLAKPPSAVEKLEKFYAENRYPSKTDYPKLAEEVGLLKKQVTEWFHHRRYLERHSTKLKEKESENAGAKETSKDFRIRRIKLPHVVRKLEKYFRVFKNARKVEKESIAKELGLSASEVTRWFCTRQNKERRLRVLQKEEGKQKGGNHIEESTNVPVQIQEEEIKWKNSNHAEERTDVSVQIKEERCEDNATLKIHLLAGAQAMLHNPRLIPSQVLYMPVVRTCLVNEDQPTWLTPIADEDGSLHKLVKGKSIMQREEDLV